MSFCFFIKLKYQFTTRLCIVLKSSLGMEIEKFFFVDLEHILKHNTFYFHKNYCSCGRRLYYNETVWEMNQINISQNENIMNFSK